MSDLFHPPALSQPNGPALSEPRRGEPNGPALSQPNGPVRRTHCAPLKYVPTAAEIDALIAAASAHPLGLDFLRDGALDCVAVTFRAHAFTVLAAREKITRSAPPASA